MFEHGGTLYTIDPAKVSNLAKAQRNMQALVLDVQHFLGMPSYPQSSGPFARMCHKTLASSSLSVTTAEPSFAAHAGLPL